MRKHTRRAFSLVELMAVVGIIMLLIAILLPALGRARETARRTVCLTNMRSIAHGCVTYSKDNSGRFPVWDQRVARYATIGEAWDWNGTQPLAPAAPANIASNTRNIWLLVRGKYGDPKTFICPSDDDAGEAFLPADMTDIYDVQNRSQFSFAYQYQGPAGKVNPTAIDDTRAGWNPNLGDDNKLVILADSSPAMKPVNRTYALSDATTGDHLFNILVAGDSSLQAFRDAMIAMSSTAAPVPITFDSPTGKGVFRVPGGDTLTALNSTNHRGDGQNVVRLDGSGEFYNHPWAGAQLDNIYTVQDPTAYEDPANLLPGAAQAVKDAVLRARMLGLYEGYTAFGAGAPAYTEAGVMQAWVYNRISKTRFPDSFLVP